MRFVSGNNEGDSASANTVTVPAVIIGNALEPHLNYVQNGGTVLNKIILLSCSCATRKTVSYSVSKG